MGSSHTHRGGRRYNGRRGRNNQEESRSPEASGAHPPMLPRAPRPVADAKASTSDPTPAPAGKPPRMAAPPRPLLESPSDSPPDRAHEGTRRDSSHLFPSARPAPSPNAEPRAPLPAPAPQRPASADAPAPIRPGDAVRAGNGKRPPAPYERRAPGEWVGPGRSRQSDAEQHFTSARENHAPRAQAGAPASDIAAPALPVRAAAAATPPDGDASPPGSTPDLPERAGHGNLPEREPWRPEVRADVGPLIDSLRGVFERDREVASHGDSARCGICYLHFSRANLVYREAEGFYVCSECMRSLGSTQVFMVRRQQK